MSVLEIELRVERFSRGAVPFRLDASFRAANGITVLLGPSGAGKSSLLLAVLGALRPSYGRIVLDGRVLLDTRTGTDLPLQRRRLGIVFQDALLFPHMSVAKNVAFGVRGESPEHRSLEMLERVGADRLADRSPGELSGGERQRVALARALAARPTALLLDEPFSSLDAGSRRALGDLLLELQDAAGVPFLHVTHDVAEAIRLGADLVVLESGHVVQSGPPARVLAAPATASTARAVGTENLFKGTVRFHHDRAGFTEVDLGGTVVDVGILDVPEGQRVALGLRAEDILVSLEAIRGTSARNVIAGEVLEIVRRDRALEVRVATPVVFRVVVTPQAAEELGLERGRRVHLLIKAHAFHRLL